MVKPVRPERSRPARSSRQFSRFYRSTNWDRVFGTHTRFATGRGDTARIALRRTGVGGRFTQGVSRGARLPSVLLRVRAHDRPARPRVIVSVRPALASTVRV